MKPFLRLFRLSVVGLSLLSPHMRVIGLPAGFEDEDVVQINQVVDMAFAGNIMLAVTKDGKLYSYDLEDANGESKLAADLTARVCSNGERGYVHYFECAEPYYYRRQCRGSVLYVILTFHLHSCPPQALVR